MVQPLDQLVEAAAGPGPGYLRPAARLMTLLEDQPQRLPEIFLARKAEDWPQPRLLLGVTGAPGSGKSTLTDALVSEYRQRHTDRRVGVIAVDPSSPFTGGAVLGDRVRMMRHATDPMVFVRSMASRGRLGGLTLGVKGVLRVMGLIGCDVVLIETVGVGQSEVEVAQVADLVMIVLAPGQGDSIQLLKAGLMEIGDIFAVNKADKPEAAGLQAQLLAAMALDASASAASGHGHGHGHDLVPQLCSESDAGPGRDLLLERSSRGRIEPRVHLVSAADHLGVPALVDDLERLTQNHADQWRGHREKAIGLEVREAVLEAVRRRLEATLSSNGQGRRSVEQVLKGQVSVEQMAQELLRKTAASYEGAAANPASTV